MTPFLATISIAILYRAAADLMSLRLTVGTCLLAAVWGASLGAFLDLATGY